MTGSDEERRGPGVNPGDEGEDEGEQLEEMIEHADRPFGSESFGTTPEEQERGESLDARLREESPERPVRDEDLEIVEAGAPDEEAEMIGEGVVERDPFVPPEESAMSVRDEAPGGVDHPDDHPPLDESDED